MKQKFLLFVFALCCLGASAEEYSSMTFTKADGTTHNLSVTSMEMVIEGSTLQIANADGKFSFPLSELTKMEFSQATAVETVNADTEAGPFSVYNLSGIYLGEAQSVDELQSTLSPGIYILKSSTTTFKLAVK